MTCEVFLPFLVAFRLHRGDALRETDLFPMQSEETPVRQATPELFKMSQVGAQYRVSSSSSIRSVTDACVVLPG
jgi:hypothetical protein